MRADESELTVLVVVRDAASHLEGLLHDLDSQTLRGCWEVVVIVDPASTDRSFAVASEWARKCQEAVKVVIGEREGLAENWNLGIKLSSAAWIVRLDANGSYPAGFLGAISVAIRSSGSDARLGVGSVAAVGGGVALSPARENRLALALAAAEQSRFVSGSVARFKRPIVSQGDISFLARAAYRRDVFSLVGGFNTMFFACEDTEFAFRFRRAGFKYKACSDVTSSHYVRSTLGALFRQKKRNGGAVWDMALNRELPTPPVKLIVAPAAISMVLITLFFGGYGMLLPLSCLIVIALESAFLARLHKVSFPLTTVGVCTSLLAYVVGGLHAVARFVGGNRFNEAPIVVAGSMNRPFGDLE